jgi:hypothetical protein
MEIRARLVRKRKPPVYQKPHFGRVPGVRVIHVVRSTFLIRCKSYHRNTYSYSCLLQLLLAEISIKPQTLPHATIKREARNEGKGTKRTNQMQNEGEIPSECSSMILTKRYPYRTHGSSSSSSKADRSDEKKEKEKNRRSNRPRDKMYAE